MMAGSTTLGTYDTFNLSSRASGKRPRLDTVQAAFCTDWLLEPCAVVVIQDSAVGGGRLLQRHRQCNGSAEKETFEMAKCEVCGNDYHLSFEVITSGSRHTFDSFECAIHKLAPVCDHCGCKIVGHGMEAGGSFYCCANCARQAGVAEMKDHA